MGTMNFCSEGEEEWVSCRRWSWQTKDPGNACGVWRDSCWSTVDSGL